MLKKICLLIFFVISLFHIESQEFPEELSSNAKISIISVNYNDIAHSLFSKSCFRIFDKKNEFDQLIDFAHFDNFDDHFFMLKFFLKNKKAKVIATPFYEYFLNQSSKTNVSLTETSLELTAEETSYIYNFIKIMHKALPEYSYDFDVLTNNSETHISQILHDCFRMKGDKSTTERYSFDNITRHNLKYKKINGSYIQVLEKEKIQIHELNFDEVFHQEKLQLIILLSIVSFIFFAVSVYQILTHYFNKIYIVSIFKSMQIFDFMVFFSSGLSGFLVILMNFFSNQTMLKHHYEFLYLFPLHVIAAFSAFKQLSTKKRRKIYWSVVSALSLVYIAIVWISESKLPIINILLVLPIFLRTTYFNFLAWTSKD